MKLFYLIRIYIKLFIVRTLHIDISSFCKECGRKIHDYDVSDETWEIIRKYIKRGNVLCYDCFCNFCLKEGLPTVWKLEKRQRKENPRKGNRYHCQCSITDNAPHL